MIAWISANLVNIALAAVLAAVVALVIRGMVRRKKAGAPSCGCGCDACGGCARAQRSEPDPR